jgi:hypothetical protein
VDLDTGTISIGFLERSILPSDKLFPIYYNEGSALIGASFFVSSTDFSIVVLTEVSILISTFFSSVFCESNDYFTSSFLIVISVTTSFFVVSCFFNSSIF